jgi:uncharacterized membrane protein YdjX (TVP38/TMEM64 family)
LKRGILIIFIACLGGGIVFGGVAYLVTHWGESCNFLNGVGIHGNIDRLKAYILSFGFWAPLISAFLMIAQSVILFLPAFPIFVVNSLVYGPFWGALLSWSSAVAGSIVCFSIAKSLGRPAVRRLVNQVHLEAADTALKRYEKYVILFFGFIPVISFDVISYAAGLTILSYGEFIPLVCIAQIPSALLYSILVHKVDRGAFDIYWVVALGSFITLTVLTLIIRAYLNRRQHKTVSETPLPNA